MRLFLFAALVLVLVRAEISYSQNDVISEAGLNKQLFKELVGDIKSGRKKINVVNDRGETALIQAILYGADEELLFLLENGVDINIKYRGLNPVFVTVSDECLYSKLTILLDFGVRIDLIEKYLSNSLLHYASQHDDTRCLELLLKEGANVGAVNDYGETPLFYSASPSVSEILWRAGANIFQKDKHGLDVIHHSVLTGRENIYRNILVKEIQKKRTEAELSLRNAD